MRRKAKKRLSMCIALVSAISLTATSIAFADGWRVGSVSNGDENADYQVGNYTFLSPGLAGTKMILSDPTLADKSWVEYVEYKLLTEVQEDDIKYYIYQPTDYSVSSIMAIKDYNPDSITGSSTNLSVSLGELSSIFEAASLGTGISSRLLGGSVEANTIASEMTSTSDIVKNSKYYSTPSFMGIPGDSEYNGVSNDGYYNASSMTISMTKSSSVQVTKTNTSSANATVGSSTSNSTSLSNSTQDSNSRAVSTNKSHTDGEDHSTTKIDTWTEYHSSNVTSFQDRKTETTYNSENKTTYNSKTTDNTMSNTINVGGGNKDFFWIQDSQTFNWGDIKHSGDDTTKHTGKDTTTQSGTETTTHEGKDNNGGTNSTDGTSSSDTTGSSLSDTVSNTISNSATSSATDGTSASMSIGYGLNYAQSQQVGLSETVSRTFSARDDDEVKNVGWKLCQYVVRVPYYIEAVKVNGAEETLIYSQYVTYDLLTGVSRVFANGYIEHWNTGELVPYADFFEGFVTATELVDIAKEQASKESE